MILSAAKKEGEAVVSKAVVVSVIHQRSFCARRKSLCEDLLSLLHSRDDGAPGVTIW